MTARPTEKTSPPSGRDIERSWFTVILLVYWCYAALFMYRTSFVVFERRFFVLFDDAMISMRYAANLAAGHGLVWNPGDTPVEGFTNPLWTFFMAAAHLLPIDHAVISVVIQITGAAALFASLFFVRKIAGLLSGNSPAVMLGAVAVTAFYYPLIYWSLMGMEVSVFILIAAAAVWMALKTLRDDRWSPWLYVLLGVGTLVRIDAAVPFVAVLAYMAVAQKRFRSRHLVWGICLLAAFLAGQTLLRLWYYGDLLPNTYYLKMTGIPVWMRIGRGLLVFADFAVRTNPVLFLLPAAFVLVRPNKYTGLLLTVAAMQFAYSIYVGGDAWEDWSGANRFISTVMPLYLILFTVALHAVIDGAMARWRGNTAGTGAAAPDGKGLSGRLRTAAFPAAMALSLFLFNSYAIGEFLMLKPPSQVDFNREMVERVEIIEYVSQPDATVAVTWAGIIPYFAGRYCIDLLGKNDRRIAHEAAHIPEHTGLFDIPLRELKPGHLKWDFNYTYGELKPDVITHQWGGGRDVAIPYIQQYYAEVELSLGEGRYHFMLRKDSPRIKWELMPANVR